jgi:hypothetical protein
MPRSLLRDGRALRLRGRQHAQVSLPFTHALLHLHQRAADVFDRSVAQFMDAAPPVHSRGAAWDGEFIVSRYILGWFFMRPSSSPWARLRRTL